MANSFNGSLWLPFLFLGLQTSVYGWQTIALTGRLKRDIDSRG